MGVAAVKPRINDRDSLAAELVEIEKRQTLDNARKKEIKVALLEAANGENYKVAIPGLGVVKVSAPKDARCTGTAPQIVVEAFLDLPRARQEKLVEQGVVTIAEQWTGKYYGSVTVELF